MDGTRRRILSLLPSIIGLLLIFTLAPCPLPLVPASSALASDWQLGLTVSVPYPGGEGGKARQTLTAGARSTALDGFDNTWDTVIYNNGSALLAYFYHPEFATDDQQLARDIRLDSYPKQWDFYLSSDQDGQPVTLARSLPQPSMGACVGVSLSLTDVTAGGPVDLTQPSYLYTNNASTTRHFQLTATQAVQNPPAAPVNLFSPRTGTTAVLLSWRPNSGGVTGYRVYRKDPGAAQYHQLTVTPTAVTKYLDQGLSPGSYSYEVTAVTADCESGPSAALAVTVGP